MAETYSPVLWMIFLSVSFVRHVSSICDNGCLYFTNILPYQPQDVVYQLDLTTHDVEQPGITGHYLRGLAYDVTSHAIYVTDVGGTRITDGKFIIRFQDHAKTKVRFPSFVVPASLAVDPISGILYYSDIKNHAIGVYTSDLHYHHLVVPEGTYNPYSLTLDPGNGTMYWLERTDSGIFQVRKAHMDGSHIQTILSGNINTPIGLTLVIEDKRLYWCSKGSHVIERALTDGSDRQVVYTLNKTSECTGMIADNNHIYWMQADSGTSKTTIWRLRRNGTGVPHNLYSRRYKSEVGLVVRGMALSTINYSSVTNRCSGSSRGGCAHICIPTTQSRVCQCSAGYILQPDGTSCRKLESGTGLMVVDSGKKELFVFDLIENASHPLNVTGRKWVPHGHISPTAVAYDDLNDIVFWVDSAKKHMESTCYPIKAGCHRRYEFGYSQFSNLVDIAIDKKKKDVYVVDQGSNYILRMPYSGGTDKKLRIVSHYEKLTSIALDTHRRMVYWTISDTQSRIERLSMDSDNPLKQYEKFIALPDRPIALAIDMEDEKLYWSGENSGVIVSVNLDGSNQKMILDQHVISAMTVGGGCLFWAFQGSKNIHAMSLNTSRVRTYRSASFRQITDLDYFSEEQAHIICNGNGSILPAPRIEERTVPDVPLIIIGPAVGGVLLFIVISIAIYMCRKRRAPKPHSGEMINGPADMELLPVQQPMTPVCDGVRAPALRPPEAMIGRPLPQAPEEIIEDSRSPQPGAPAEAGFRQFLLRSISTTAPEYEGLLRDSQREDRSYSPLNQKKV